jgi:hypothetical protein
MTSFVPPKAGTLRLQSAGQPDVIMRDRLVYVADPANPRLRDGRLTVDDLAALPHAAARFPDPGSDPAGMALLRRGISLPGQRQPGDAT